MSPGQSKQGSLRARVGGFIWAHGEKLGVAGVAVCMVLLVSSGLHVERLAPDTANQLHEEVKSANNHILRDGFPSILADDYLELDGFSFPQVGLDDYEQESWTPWDPPLFRAQKKRRDPALLTVEDVKVRASAGLFALADPLARRASGYTRAHLKSAGQGGSPDDDGRTPRQDIVRGHNPDGAGFDMDEAIWHRKKQRRDKSEGQSERTHPTISDMPGVVPPADANIEIRHFAVVAGRIPVAEQVERFRRALGDSPDYDPGYDRPRYYAFQIQRAQVSESGTSQWGTARTISGHSIDREMHTWAALAEEVVDARYVHPARILTMPLGPLVGQSWGEWATHPHFSIRSPESIPVLELPSRVASSPESNGTQDELDPRGSKWNTNARRRAAFHARRGAVRGRFRGFPRPSRKPLIDRDAPTWQPSRGPWLPPAPELLFRAIDYDVEPGRRYRYRVRLALHDPNHRVPTKRLATSVIDRRRNLGQVERRYVLTDWSQPTRTIYVPSGGRVLAGPAKRPRLGNPYWEPRILALIKAIEPNEKVEVGVERYLSRGSVANTGPVNVRAVDPVKRTQRQKKNVSLTTHALVLDIHGGRRLSRQYRDLVEPSQMLILDAGGRLVVRDELEDGAEFDVHRKR